MAEVKFVTLRHKGELYGCIAYRRDDEISVGKAVWIQPSELPGPAVDLAQYVIGEAWPRMPESCSIDLDQWREKKPSN